MRSSSFFTFAILILAPALIEAASLPSTREESPVMARTLPANNPADTSCVEIVDGFCIPIPAISELSPRESAGLAWGPIPVGNLRVYVIKPHNDHKFGKFTTPGVWHINIHVDKALVPAAKGWKEVLNLHAGAYKQGNRRCLYIWDSVSKKTYLDKCYGDWRGGLSEAVKMIRDVVKGVLDNANFIASAVIIAALVVAVIAAMSSLIIVAV